MVSGSSLVVSHTVNNGQAMTTVSPTHTLGLRHLLISWSPA